MIYNSGYLSSSLGLTVLYAASMAEQHATKAEIARAVNDLKRYISSAFIIKSAHSMCQAGQIPKQIQVVCGCDY